MIGTGPGGLAPPSDLARIGNRRTLLLGGLLAALALGAAAILAAGAPPWHTPALTTTPEAAAPSPASLAASRGVGSDQHAFWVARSRNGLLAVNTEQRMRARFSAGGVRVAVPGGSVTLALHAVGRGNSLESVSRAKPVARANRVSYGRSGLVEWYANGPLGLEQGLTLRGPPATEAGADGTLGLSFALSGAAARLQGGQLSFDGADGSPILRYSGLSATDAAGKVLPSYLQLDGGKLMIRVNDRGARYPVTIDPLMQVATLKATDSQQGSTFGFRTAVSGSTLVVGDGDEFGASPSHGGAGAVYVFTEPASGWANATQVAILTESAGSALDQLGWSVAISGNTVFAGAPGANGETGAVDVFTEPAGGWKNMTPTAVLTASASVPGFSLGSSLAVAGSTVFVGDPGAGGASEGAVLIFTEPGSAWSSEHQSAVLTPSDSNSDEMGNSVALSGQTLIAGAPGADSAVGAVYVFTEPGGGWASGHQNAVLSESTAGGLLGYTVAIDGSTVAAGAPFQKIGSTLGAGAVYVYSKPASGWATTAAPTAELTATDTAADPLGGQHRFGQRLTIGQYGNPGVETIFAGTGDGSGVYEFTEPASGWKSTTDSAVLGLQSASTFSLNLIGSYLFEGVDNSESTAAVTPADGQLNVFFGGGPGGPGGPSGPPANTGLPQISGTAQAGKRLSCSTGSWTNSPTSFAYGWSLSGTPIQGASSSAYTVQTIDEQLTLTCTVTASNALGAGQATSRGVQVPVPHVARCPAATGRLAGTTLGLVKLGMSRGQARRKYKHSSNRGKKYEDFFCLTPIGVRVGYASPKLLHALSKRERNSLSDRVVWASTSSAYYTIHGVRAGATITAAATKLKIGKPFRIGRNIWYLAANGSSTAVLKVRGGVVDEIGIGDKELSRGHKAQLNFLKSFS
jgi:hypothetical protein